MEIIRDYYIHPKACIDHNRVAENEYRGVSGESRRLLSGNRRLYGSLI